MPGPPNYSDDGEWHTTDTDTSSEEDIDDSFMQHQNMKYSRLPYGPRAGNAGPTPTSNHDVETGDLSTPIQSGSDSDYVDASTHSNSNNEDASTALLGVHDPAHPAREVITLAEVLLALYMIMLGYLNWGPTTYSPREKYTILFWVSIGMLIYAGIAVLGVLKMHKMGGAWTRRASFFSYTIYLAAMVGFAVLVVLVSFH